LLVERDHSRAGRQVRLPSGRLLDFRDLPIADIPPLIDANEEEKQYEGMRNSLDIRASSSAQRITKLSGGNQQKVMLGRALMSKSRILLLNEPTRGVDVGTRVEIHAAIRKLAQSGYAIIVSSSDIPELVSVSDRCLVLSAGQAKGLLDRTQISEDNITALAIGQAITGDSQ
jgi:ABC-type sugar transport system ATPase subunit